MAIGDGNTRGNIDYRNDVILMIDVLSDSEKTKLLSFCTTPTGGAITKINQKLVDQALTDPKLSDSTRRILAELKKNVVTVDDVFKKIKEERPAAPQKSAMPKASLKAAATGIQQPIATVAARTLPKPPSTPPPPAAIEASRQKHAAAEKASKNLSSAGRELDTALENYGKDKDNVEGVFKGTKQFLESFATVEAEKRTGRPNLFTDLKIYNAAKAANDAIEDFLGKPGDAKKLESCRKALKKYMEASETPTSKPSFSPPRPVAPPLPASASVTQSLSPVPPAFTKLVANLESAYVNLKDDVKYFGDDIPAFTEKRLAAAEKTFTDALNNFKTGMLRNFNSNNPLPKNDIAALNARYDGYVAKRTELQEQIAMIKKAKPSTKKASKPTPPPMQSPTVTPRKRLPNDQTAQQPPLAAQTTNQATTNTTTPPLKRAAPGPRNPSDMQQEQLPQATEKSAPVAPPLPELGSIAFAQHGVAVAERTFTTLQGKIAETSKNLKSLNKTNPSSLDQIDKMIKELNSSYTEFTLTRADAEKAIDTLKGKSDQTNLSTSLKKQGQPDAVEKSVKLIIEEALRTRQEISQTVATAQQVAPADTNSKLLAAKYTSLQAAFTAFDAPNNNSPEARESGLYAKLEDFNEAYKTFDASIKGIDLSSTDPNIVALKERSDAFKNVKAIVDQTITAYEQNKAPLIEDAGKEYSKLRDLSTEIEKAYTAAQADPSKKEHFRKLAAEYDKTFTTFSNAIKKLAKFDDKQTNELRKLLSLTVEIQKRIADQTVNLQF